MSPKLHSLVTLAALSMLGIGSGIEPPPLPSARSGRSPYPGGYPSPRPNDRARPPEPEGVHKDRLEAAEEKRVRKAARRLGIQAKICSGCAKLFVHGVVVYGCAELCSTRCAERLAHAIDETTPPYELKAGA